MAQETKSNKVVLKMLKDCINYVSSELQREETKCQIKTEILHPLLRIIYQEIYPYMLFILASILVILVLSLVILGLILVFYKKGK
jgi:hypothetical protein